MSLGETSASEGLRSFYFDLPQSHEPIQQILVANHNLLEQATIISAELKKTKFQTSYYRNPIFLKFPNGNIARKGLLRRECLEVTTEMGIFLNKIYGCLANLSNFESRFGYSMLPLLALIKQTESAPLSLVFDPVEMRRINIQGSRDTLLRGFRKLAKTK